ncbi:MAG: GSCFA domain-containing protein [Fluviicola sp.]|nr:GSCFA domain-containing protein [Fluviicola sp.]
MNFTTKTPIKKYNHPITYDSKIMLLGSCFATNIGDKFQYFKFQATTNPFGIIFNPVSLAKLIERSAQKEYYTEKDIFFHNDLWQTHCIITLGTSWVYRNIETNEIVANCHKVPQKQFIKELLSPEIIVQSIESILFSISVINPNCKSIFTISPVRHLKDGFTENTLSKAHLIAALHNIISNNPSHTNYFPAYEIVMDELRDYRFYAEDLLHPNQTAIDYIWIQFFENYFSESEFGLMNEICEIQRGLKHRPFNPNSESHQKFLAELKTKMTTIEKKLPFVSFEN